MMTKSGAPPRSQPSRSQMGAQVAFHEAIGRMETIVEQETALLREKSRGGTDGIQ